jgi:hypothetical protein
VVAFSLKMIGAISIATCALAFLPFEASADEGKARGDISNDPLTLESPLSPLPVVHGNVRRIILPFPPANLPEEAATVDRGMGGTVRLFAALEDGWLVGTDAGEWIGTLSIERPAGRKILAKGNVLGAFSWHGRLYVLTGLKHLMLNEGELWEVDLEGERLVRRTSLAAAPVDILITKEGRPIIRTAKGDVALLEDGSTVDPATL